MLLFAAHFAPWGWVVMAISLRPLQVVMYIRMHPQPIYVKSTYEWRAMSQPRSSWKKL
jgi:hypothetical protein